MTVLLKSWKSKYQGNIINVYWEFIKSNRENKKH